jgi:hypothetical protein
VEIKGFIMRRAILAILILIVVTSCLACPRMSLAGAKYSGGSGEPNNPYQIANVADLLALAADTNDYNKCFILTADIDLGSSGTFTTAVITGKAFAGVFDGAGHKIINLTINTNGVGNDYLGLFVAIDHGGEIKNLGLENVSITGGEESYFLGGLVGENYYGTISNCYSKGTVTGGSYARLLGGLAGGNWYGSISDCFSTGDVASGNNSEFLGGLVGFNYYGSISSCYSTGAVIVGSNSDHIGGFVGFTSYGTISNCYSTSVVNCGNSSQYVGGLAGVNDDDGIIKNCFSTGEVAGWGYVGGLVGWNGGDISGSYFLDVAGLNNGCGTPLTDGQMKQQNSFIGWDFNDVWTICETTNYPKLLWQILPADIVCPDGVDILDLATLCEQWLIVGPPHYSADISPSPNGDGIVNFADLAAMANHWLEGF